MPSGGLLQFYHSGRFLCIFVQLLLFFLHPSTHKTHVLSIHSCTVDIQLSGPVYRNSLPSSSMQFRSILPLDPDPTEKCDFSDEIILGLS